VNKAKGFSVLFIIVAMLTGGTLIHEYTHIYFNERAGCESDLQFFTEGHEGTGPAIAAVNATCTGTAEELNRLGQRQAMVEAVGYQVLPLYLTIGLLVALQVTGSDKRCRRCRR